MDKPRIQIVRVGIKVMLTFTTKSEAEAKRLQDGLDKQIKGEGRIGLVFPRVIKATHEQKVATGLRQQPPERGRRN